MDRLEQMRALAAVVANRSFTAAAARLGLTPQAVSKAVKALEEDLGARLLNRTTRVVQPTETGLAFYERARRLLDDFDELRAAMREEHRAPRGHLRLTAPASFGELHLADLTGRFLEAYPETSIDLHLTDRHVSLIDEGFDLAIRIGALESSGLIARRLAAAPIRLCASPAYLAEAGAPQSPSDIAAHRCVIDANFREGGVWRFEVEGAPVSVRPPARLSVNSALAVRRLVLAGAGLALCPDYVVKQDLESGALVSLLEGAVAYDLDVFAVYLESRHLSGKLRAFIDFAAAELARR
ncbi:MAG: LysR family transcriptional regulator [Pseudomonadota bacterium]